VPAAVQKKVLPTSGGSGVRVLKRSQEVSDRQISTIENRKRTIDFFY
jgi:uncharacterized protein (DUF111 family)